MTNEENITPDSNYEVEQIEKAERGNKKENIRIFVDLDWTADDIIRFYSSVQNLYDYYTYYTVLSKGVHKISKKSKLALALVYSKIFDTKTILINVPDQIHTFHKSSDKKVHLDIPLKIKKVRFASPGFHDFTGAGSIVGHLKDILFKLIDVYQSKDKREIETKRLELENEIFSIERDNKIIQTYKELGFNNEQILDILYYESSNIKTIASFIEKDKITKIK